MRIKFFAIQAAVLQLAIFPTTESSAAGAQLSPTAVLNRCYMQLTQNLLPPNDPLNAKVEGGQDPITVCINDVFKAAFLIPVSGGYVVPPESQALGKMVIHNFHLLHSSWLHFRGLGNPPVTVGTINTAMSSIYEPNGAANYFTRSLFDLSVNADYAMVGTEYLRSARDGGQITDSIYNVATEDAKYSNFLNSGINVMYERGTVTGINILAPEMRTFATTTQDNYGRGTTAYPTTSLTLFQHFGGGFLGLDYYLARTFDETINSKGDGVIEVPRKWSENIFHDLMCLELPVVRESDAVPFVVPNADGPFRRAAGCTSCHVTIDRMAGLVKSLAYGERRTQSVWTTWIDTSKWNKGSSGDYSWSSNYRTTYTASGATHSNYRKEDHVGTIYYRDYTGSLIDVRVDSIASLGAALAQQKQPYMCAAKRYYQYFTGIDVDISDPGPDPLPRSPEDQAHFDFVETLASKAFRDGSPAEIGKMSSIIEEILKSPQYRKSDFGVAP